jgi:hypothetical protein
MTWLDRVFKFFDCSAIDSASDVLNLASALHRVFSEAAVVLVVLKKLLLLVSYSY